MRAGVPAAAGQHRFQQPGPGTGQRRPHRLLQHAQSGTGAEHPGGQAGQPAYLRGGDLLEPRREPPPFPPGERGAVPVAGRAAQIASLTCVTSSTSAANR